MGTCSRGRAHWVPGRLSTHQCLSPTTGTALPGPGRVLSPAGALLLVHGCRGCSPVSPLAWHQAGRALVGTTASRVWPARAAPAPHCGREMRFSVAMARRKQLFPLQSAAGNVVQSPEDSAAFWGALCPVPVPRLPQHRARGPVPGIPRAPRRDGFLHGTGCGKMLGLCTSQFWGLGDGKGDTG